MKDWPGALGGFIYRRRWWIVIVAVLLTLVGGYLAGNLQFRSHLTDTMPEEHPQVKAYLDIMDEFDSSDMVIVVVQGENPEQLGEFAERLAPRLDALDEYVGWVNYRLDDEYIAQHGLMLAKASDLEKLRPSFATTKLDEVMVELNNSLEETYIGGGVEDQERENEAIASIAGLHRFASRLAGHALNRDDTSVGEQVKLAVRELSLGDRYIYSPDRTVLMMWLQPNFSMTDYELMVDGINGIEAVCK
ncbi:hypothetical protein K8R78_02570, partial [bacterium]|nr:hypothetical protein [bacterium]